MDNFQEQEMFVQQDSAVLDTNRQGSDNDPEDPTIVLDEILKDPSFMDGVCTYINQSKPQSCPTVVDDSGEQILLKNLSHHAPSQTNEYVELNDLENAMNKNWNPNEGYANFVTGEGENSKLYQRIEAELLDSTYHCSEQHKLLQDVQAQDDLSVQTPDFPIFADGYDVGQQDQDLIFYDAFYPSKAESSSLELNDEIDKYFDAMENDLPYDNISISENSEQTNPSSFHLSNIKVDTGLFSVYF